MAEQTEHDIQTAIRIALSERGVVLRMNVGTFRTSDGRVISTGLPPGTSDLLFIGQGRVAFIEVKTANGRASGEQLRFLERMRALGHSAGIARSVADAMRIAGEAGAEGASRARKI